LRRWWSAILAGSRITVRCRSYGNTSTDTHERRRREVRRLLEWVVGDPDPATMQGGLPDR